MIQVDANWWRDFFNEIYLTTDARTICNRQLTTHEVDFLEGVLDLKTTDRILDLCGGQGRHCLELARRGYRDLTVVDQSHFLLCLGRRSAQEEGSSVTFCRGDVRNIPLKSKGYSVILVMANSFGYFLDEEDNYRVLKEVFRLLRHSGKVLLDIADRDHVTQKLHPVDWFEINEDVIVCRMRELDRELVKVRELVLSKQQGLLRDGTYCMHIYGHSKIREILKKVGFAEIEVKKGCTFHEKLADFGLVSSRTIVIAKKR
jgi:D-alanine-D-alanine ligase